MFMLLSPRAFFCAAFTLVLFGLSCAGCRISSLDPGQKLSSGVNPTPLEPSPSTLTPEGSSSTRTDEIAERFRFPAHVDPSERYMFYLHGKIVEDLGLPAFSPEYGEYKYEEILEALESFGFHIISEQRPKDADGWEYARRTSQQLEELLAAGVPPSSITVVGASKGASIATAVSYLVGDPDVNYVLLGSCHPTLIDEWTKQGVTLSGNVLAIYDIADDEYSGSCQELFDSSGGKGLSRFDELVLEVGTGHRILYEPIPEWVIPTVQWAGR